MIIFFGPAGAGKSMQGQIMSARHGWRWLSAGQLLRDTRDPELFRQMKTGELLDKDLVNRIVFEALDAAKTCEDVSRVILDGFPRAIQQAHDFVEHEIERCGDNGIGMVVVLEVPKSEILARLAIRGRAEDEPDAIERRLQVYRSEIYPLLEYFNELKVPIAHIDGTGTVGEVHDRIETELVANGLVEPV